VQRFAGTGGATPYEQKATIAAAIAEVSATSTIIVLAKGFVSHVWLKFPTGSAGLLHISVYNEATKLWPGIAGQWFTGDNEVVEFDTEYDVPLVGGVYKLTIKGWNEDDSYPHSVIARVWVIALP
jgi:hypothetical protein